MSPLSVNLFGRFEVRHHEQTLHRLETAKSRELFALLLLHRDRDLSRDMLADMLWGEAASTQSRKYLRQALWQLQAGLRFHLGEAGTEILIVEADWVRLNPDANLWLDVREFDICSSMSQGVRGQDLNREQFRILQNTVDLYQGDLLEGWYQDWCSYERHRLQTTYVMLLDKLMDACDVHGDYELALDYGERIVRADAAHERTHRRLMRMYYLAGERTAALRQYERCVSALRDELGVDPSESTRALYTQISKDQLERHGGQLVPPPLDAVSSALPEILAHLKQMHALVCNVQRQLRDDITSVEQSLALTERLPRNGAQGIHRRA